MTPLLTLNSSSLAGVFHGLCSPHCHSSTLSSVTKWVIFGQSGKEQEQNSVHVKPTERHWHLLLSLQFPSLQYRWMMSRTSLCAGAFRNITGSMDPSSLSFHPLPSGSQRWGLVRSHWHHKAVWYKALKTCCWKASSVGVDLLLINLLYMLVCTSAHPGWCRDGHSRFSFGQTAGEHTFWPQAKLPLGIQIVQTWPYPSSY